MSVAFDTLSAAEEFQKAGMTKDQAKVQVGTISKALGSFATQGDVKEYETNLGHEIKEVETNLENKIDVVETRLENKIEKLGLKLTIRLGAMMAVSIGLVAAMVKFL